MKFKCALFDFDMTLIDSIGPLTVSANLLAREFGLPEVSYEEVYQAEVALPNCTFEGLWSYLWGRYDPLWYEAYRDRHTEAEYAAMELYPTGRETLEALRDRGVVLGLASNRDRPRLVLESMGLSSFFPVVVGQYDVERPKPAPDMIDKAVELMGARPEDVLYVCDSRGDLVAARAAGVRTFAMTTGGHSAAELLSLGAWKTGDRLSEVVAAFI